MSKKRNNKTVVKEYQPIPESMEDKAVECIEPEVSEAEQPVMEAANDKDVPNIIEGDILNEDVVNGEPCTEDAPVSSSETCETDKDAVIDLASSEVDKDMVIDSEACKVTEDTSCSEETNTETIAQETPDDGESNEETPEEVENDFHYVPISGNDDDDASDYYERSGNEKKQEKKPKNYDWIFYLVIAASMIVMIFGVNSMRNKIVQSNAIIRQQNEKVEILQARNSILEAENQALENENSSYLRQIQELYTAYQKTSESVDNLEEEKEAILQEKEAIVESVQDIRTIIDQILPAENEVEAVEKAVTEQAETEATESVEMEQEVDSTETAEHSDRRGFRGRYGRN